MLLEKKKNAFQCLPVLAVAVLDKKNQLDYNVAVDNRYLEHLVDKHYYLERHLINNIVRRKEEEKKRTNLLQKSHGNDMNYLHVT